ncbi:unnamed protein product [Thlaspi arvense]|uniref:Uncharacterized protein n=1 Tax=Thlaspi arvense TaxID=13288 RepID=A0AAU9S8K7_THLAR|nr:unnamed protein product [Thlaspi arvense]
MQMFSLLSSPRMIPMVLISISGKMELLRGLCSLFLLLGRTSDPHSLSNHGLKLFGSKADKLPLSRKLINWGISTSPPPSAVCVVSRKKQRSTSSFIVISACRFGASFFSALANPDSSSQVGES